MQFLSERVFDPVLRSPDASDSIKQGVRLTMIRMRRLNAVGMIKYYWSAIAGTERSPGFAAKMRAEGFTRFEEVIDDFRARFTDEWISS